MDPELIERIWRIFMPEAGRRLDHLKANNVRFAHYTSAEAGMAILKSGRMLLRNSMLMNDFSEVQHGMECLAAAYRSPVGERLKVVMRNIQQDLPEILESNFNESFRDVRRETYLVSISEHGDPKHGDGLEDAFGRLSMWRAYASRNGIAFIFNNGPFTTENNAINAFSSPVLYATQETFAEKFEELVVGIEANLELAQSLGGKYFHDTLMNAFRFSIQSTKHPAFREEREWRVIYSPTEIQRSGEMTPEQLEKIPTEIITLNGVPQRIYAIPFKDHPEEGFVGATIPALLDRVLIGPSMDEYAIAQAFVAELTHLGVENAQEKVVMTGIPLRL
ncbi:MAG TPA: DUF2971 domain-containing protein [Allosphingosinicella sp.]|jgi:hypothetical protein